MGTSDGFERLTPAPVRELEERYAYYRRCQHFRRNGEQCKGPAMKGDTLCYQHDQQKDKMLRRERFALPALVDRKAVQSALRQVAQAIIDGQIEDEFAGELLQRIESASRNLALVR